MHLNKNRGALIGVPFILIFLIIIALIFLTFTDFFSKSQSIHNSIGNNKDSFLYSKLVIYSPNVVLSYFMDGYCSNRYGYYDNQELLIKGDTDQIRECWNSFFDRINCCSKKNNKNARILSARLYIENYVSLKYQYKCNSDCHHDRRFKRIEKSYRFPVFIGDQIKEAEMDVVYLCSKEE